MKIKTKTTILCELTDQEIGSKNGVILVGTLYRLTDDGKPGEAVLTGGAEGAAYSVAAFVGKVKGGDGTKRQRRGSVEHVPAEEIVKALRASPNKTASLKSLAEKLGKDIGQLRKGTAEAVEAGQIVSPGRGVYQIAAKAA